jgi:hypothetical protein
MSKQIPIAVTDQIVRQQERINQLEIALNSIIRAAEYVCVHKFGDRTPAGTRIIAVESLRDEIKKSKTVAAMPNVES